jgi:hypothetical protein
MGTNNLFGASEDLVQGQSGRIENDSVCRWLEGRFGAITVAFVPFLHITDNSLLPDPLLFGYLRIETGHRLSRIGVERLKRRNYLTIAPVAADLGGSVEEDLDLCIGKHCCSDVTAFHDDTSSGTQGSLLLDHPGAKAWVDRDLGGGGGDIGFTDAAGHILAIEQDAVSLGLGLKGNARVGCEVEKRSFLVEGQVVLDGLESEGAIHRSGL